MSAHKEQKKSPKVFTWINLYKKSLLASFLFGEHDFSGLVKNRAICHAHCDKVAGLQYSEFYHVFMVCCYQYVY